jgi:hypothetical protein
MPMIDVYAAAGTFAEPHQLATDLARTLMVIEGVPDIPMFRQNTAAFIHDLPGEAISNVDGESRYVRVQVLTNATALDREKQLAVVAQFRVWVLLTEAVDGGWGLWGHAHTNDELIQAARSQIAQLAGESSIKP